MGIKVVPCLSRIHLPLTTSTIEIPTGTDDTIILHLSSIVIFATLPNCQPTFSKICGSPHHLLQERCALITPCLHMIAQCLHFGFVARLMLQVGSEELVNNLICMI